MYLSPHSVPLSELVCLQSARIINNSPLWTKTPRQCTFFLTLQNIWVPGCDPRLSECYCTVICGGETGGGLETQLIKSCEGLHRNLKRRTRFDDRLRNWESWPLVKDIKKGISKHSAVWLIIIMGNIQSQANKCAFSWLWQSQEIIELSLLRPVLLTTTSTSSRISLAIQISHKNSEFGTGFR